MAKARSAGGGGARSARRGPEPERVERALRFASLPGKSLKDAALRYGLSQAALKRAKASAPPVKVTLEDLVLSGLGMDSPVAARDLLPYLDYVDHVLYAEAEIEGVMRALAERGLVAERDGGWVLARDWP